jgi:putative transposase
VGACWYADETYVKVAGTWAYLYRAADETGQVVNVLLREHRDLASARAFFEQATRRRGSLPTTVVTDKHPAYGRAVRRHMRRAVLLGAKTLAAGRRRGRRLD